LPVLRLRILLTAHPELLSALLQIIHLVIAGFVAVTDEGVRVNGQLLSLSTPLKADKAGRPLPRYRSSALTLGAKNVAKAPGSRADATFFVSDLNFDSRIPKKGDPTLTDFLGTSQFFNQAGDFEPNGRLNDGVQPR